MKIEKIVFLSLCIFLVGCNSEISKKQQSTYPDTLKEEYPQYSYSYMKKDSQYEVEFTNDLEEEILTPQDYYSAVPLKEVFEDDGKYKQETLELLKESKSLSFLPLEYLTGDFLYMIVNDTYRTYDNFKVMRPPLIPSPNANKIIKVLTDEPFIFISDNRVQLAQNTKDGIYSLLINDQATFNLLKTIYSNKDNIKKKNEDISQLLALNEELLISLDAKDINFPKEELNRRLTILNNFLEKSGIKKNATTASFLQSYKDTRNSFYYVGAITLAIDNRRDYINEMLSYSSQNTMKEEKVESEVPETKYEHKDDEILYRGDKVESKYTYKSLIVKSAIEAASKVSEVNVKNNYSVVENEVGQLGITIYSEKIQDEVVENYIFDPYTKKITNREEYSPDDSETVSMVINEAISVIEQETNYSNQSGYIMDAYVTDDGYIAVDINISDNNSGEVIKQDQAVYNPETHLIKEFPKNSPTTSNNDVNENSIIEEAISIIEEKTGYIEGNPYVYEAYENEEDGSVIVEVRAAGAGTMSIVDRFQFLPDTKNVYIYDTPSNSYNPY